MNFRRLGSRIALPEIEWEYILATPSNYHESGVTWPLIIILHGRGERGDMNGIEERCIPRIIANGFENRFVVLAPKCPLNTSWPLCVDGLNGLLSQILANEPIDSRRVYLTGYSMGGNGAWVWASRSLNDSPPLRLSVLEDTMDTGSLT